MLGGLVRDLAPRIFLFPSSTVGNDLAPRLAARCGCPAVLDCVGFTFEGDAPVLRRLEFDAKALTSYSPLGGGTVIASMRDGIAEAAPAGGGGAGQAERVVVELAENDLRSAVERREVVRKTVNLKDARVIVGGGAGVGTADNFKLLEDLAAGLGGEIGATRATVDAGWVSAERQIGQTGVTVRPDLYIACGISGAVQHCVGIRDAKTIVAVNTDPDAQIFRVADFGIVGDMFEVIPALTERLQKMKAA